MSGDSGPGAPCAVVWHERTIRARVEHVCSGCAETVRAGDRYVKHVCIVEPGDGPTVWTRCARCETIYRWLRAHPPVDDPGALPDADLGCGHTYEEVYGEPPPADVAVLAFALPGETEIP